MNQSHPCDRCGATFPSPHAVEQCEGVWLCPECTIDAGYCLTCQQFRPDEIHEGDLPGLCAECQRLAWEEYENEGYG